MSGRVELWFLRLKVGTWGTRVGGWTPNPVELSGAGFCMVVDSSGGNMVASGNGGRVVQVAVPVRAGLVGPVESHADRMRAEGVAVESPRLPVGGEQPRDGAGRWK
jgi:hypothetical protein